MTTEKKPKAFFTMNLPRKPKQGDVISIGAKLKVNPSEFRLILGVKMVGDRNSSIEPTMVALEFKTVFHAKDIEVTTNWKTDTGWKDEEMIDSDWIDSRGNVNLKLSFENSSVLIMDEGKSLITEFPMKFELDKINRLQLWGNIKEMQKVSLKYNQNSKLRRSRKKSNSN